MGKSLRRAVFILLALTVMFVLTGCGEEKYTYTNTAMGTMVSVTVYANDEEKAHLALQKIYQKIVELEQNTFSAKISTSELGFINSKAGSPEGSRISGLLHDAVLRSKALYDETDGAIDISLGKLTALWDLDEAAKALGEDPEYEYRIPSVYLIANLLEAGGSEKIILTEDRITLPAYMALDLGAVAKGIALDELKTLLKSMKEIKGAVISIGGSVLTYGKKNGNRDWTVAVSDPFNTGETIGTVKLMSNQCISTSGDYERYVEVNGIVYHHIIDSHTGYPAASGIKSVTVVSEDGFLTDALATAIFVMGPEDGMILAERKNVPVLIVRTNGDIIMNDLMKAIYSE